MNKYKALRIKEGYTQQAWADLFGVRLNTIQKWESEENKPGWKSKENFMKLFKVDVDALFTEVVAEEVHKRR